MIPKYSTILKTIKLIKQLTKIDICDLLLVRDKDGKLKKFPSLLKIGFVFLVTLNTTFVSNQILTNTEFIRTQHDKRIVSRMKQNVAECGSGNYVSWIVVRDEQILSFDLSPKQFMFKEIYGCNNLNNEKCGLDEVRNILDQFSYNKIFHIDSDPGSYIDILNLEEGFIHTHLINYDEKNSKIINNSIPDPIKAVLDSFNLKIGKVSFTVVKDMTNQLIYIFVSSYIYTDNPRNNCSTQTDNALLLDLARIAKGSINNWY